MRNFMVLIIISLFSLVLGCRQPSNETLSVPSTVQEIESTATLEEVGLNEAKIWELVDSIRSGFYPNRHSLLIYKDHQLVLEEYFAGKDENWGNDIGVVQHNDTVLHDMRSVSKSVVSACIGLAIAQGKIKNVDQPIFDFFEDYKQFNNEGREQLTIKHLLTMTSGLDWNEEVPYDNPENSEMQMIDSDDGIGFVLSRQLTTQPGTEWKYNGGTTELLAEIIRRVSGKNVHGFAKEHLFEPLGIERSEWTVSPATNTPSAASGLRLTSKDMLKFGILYHDQGRWGEKQILPKEWIIDSFQSSIERPRRGGYGYQFWVFTYAVGGQELSIPAAVGNGDQRIFFDQKNDLLVVTTAGNYNKWNIENNAGAILDEIYQSFH